MNDTLNDTQLSEIERKAAESMKAPENQKLMDKLQPGTHFLQKGGSTVGIVHPPTKGDEDTVLEARTGGYVFAECFSQTSSEGEMSSLHVTRIERVLTGAEYDLVRAAWQTA